MIGIDAKIDALNTTFNTKLFTAIIDNTYDSKGRAFVNLRDGLPIPEIQTKSTTEYLDVLLNDGIDGLSFFVVDSHRDNLTNYGSIYTTKVTIYFAVNLDVLYPSISERATEYLHRDVLRYIKGSEFLVESVITGLDAFSDFDFVKPGDNMEPFYLVAFNTKIEYNIKC